MFRCLYGAPLLSGGYRVGHHLVAFVEGSLVELLGSLRDSREDGVLDGLRLHEALVFEDLRGGAERDHVDDYLAAELLARGAHDRQEVDVGVELRRVGDEEVVEDDRSAGSRVVAVGVARLLREDYLKVRVSRLRVVYFAAVVDDFRLGSAAAGFRPVGLALHRVEAFRTESCGLTKDHRGEDDSLSAGSSNANFKTIAHDPNLLCLSLRARNDVVVTVSVLAGGLYVDELADDDLVLELLGRHLVGLGLEDGVLFEVLDVVGRAAALVLASELRMAVGDDFDYREALLLVLDGLLEYLLALHRVGDGGARYEGRAGALGELANVEDGVDCAVGGGGGEGAFRRRRGGLASGHAVDVVVHDYGGDAYVAAAGVDEVVASDGGSVSVAHDVDYRELGIRHLNAGRKGERTSVRGVKRAGVYISGHTARAADTGRNAYLLLGYLEVGEGAEYGVHDDSVSAAGAPDMGHELGTQKFLNVFAWHRYATSLMKDIISAGL